LKKIASIVEAMKLIDRDMKIFETNLIKTDMEKEDLYKEILDYRNRIDNIQAMIKEESRNLATE